MNKSEKTEALFAALSKAQGVMSAAAKNRANPFFKSNYADLASIWEVCRKPLADNGLAVLQPVTITPEGNVAVETVLAHVSDQWASSVVTLKPTKNDPQGVGSAITYAKRYGLSALVGVVTDDEDDDGNGASVPSKRTATEEAAAVGKPDLDGAKGKHLLALFNEHDIDPKLALDYFGANGYATLDEVPDKTVANIEKKPAQFKAATERGAK
jgi:hypothetical protein